MALITEMKKELDYLKNILELMKENEKLKNEKEEETKRLKRENYVLMAICLGNYNYADEFKKIVIKDVGDRSVVREMMRGGKDCGVIADYFDEEDFDDLPEEEYFAYKCDDEDED